MEVVKNTSLVKVFKGVPSVSHYVIAEYSKNDKDSIARLIRAHKQDFETFGPLNYELQEVKAGKGISRRKIYWLNEQQSYLLLTYLKNTKEVREFKIKLINEYFLLRNSIAQPPQNCPAADNMSTRIAGYKGQLALKKKEIERLRFELIQANEKLKEYEVVQPLRAAVLKEYKKQIETQKHQAIMLEHNILDLAGGYARLREEILGSAEALELVANSLKERIKTIDHFIKGIERYMPAAKDVAKTATKHAKTNNQWMMVSVKQKLKGER